MLCISKRHLESISSIVNEYSCLESWHAQLRKNLGWDNLSSTFTVYAIDHYHLIFPFDFPSFYVIRLLKNWLSNSDHKRLCKITKCYSIERYRSWLTESSQERHAVLKGNPSFQLKLKNHTTQNYTSALCTVRPLTRINGLRTIALQHGSTRVVVASE